jgi:hypothetical protein
MSANVYTIESLLVGKTYYSNSVKGEIISAEIHPKGVWYKDCETYLVQVRPHGSWNDTYRTVAVKTVE